MDERDLNYRREGGFYLIELKLNTPQQLFNSLDPSSFHDKDLDAVADEYISEAAAELPHDAPLKLLIHLPEAVAGDARIDGLEGAIHNYYHYRAGVTQRQFTRVLEQGRKALAIGLLFLVFCIVAQQGVAALGRSGLLWSILEEGVLITGWVAMWYPVNLFLYEWWPIRRRARLQQRLARMPVELLFR